MSYRYENLTFEAIDNSDRMRAKANQKSCDALLAALRRHHGETEPKPTARPCEALVRLASAQAARHRFVNGKGWFPRMTTKPKTTMAWLANEICRKHQVSVEEFKSHRRHKYLQAPRFEFYWRAKHEADRTFPQIGLFMNRDHSTIVYGAQQYEARMKQAAE